MKSLIKKVFTNYNLLKFWIRLNLYGFDYATSYLRTLNREDIVIILKKYGAEIGENVDLEMGLTIHNIKNGFINLKIGKNCHLGKNVFLDLKNKIIIESNVTISMGSTILTHMDCGKCSLGQIYPPVSSPVIIKSNSYIGANCTIISGVSIGQSSLIAAGSVVIASCADNSFVSGIPAKARPIVNI